MMQGDSRSLAITILKSDGTALADTDVTDVEVCFGSIKKLLSTDGVSYDTDSGKWMVALTQEETFKLPAAHVRAQIRVLWTNGTVEGVDLGCVDVRESLSKEVLGA